MIVRACATAAVARGVQRSASRMWIELSEAAVMRYGESALLCAARAVTRWPWPSGSEIVASNDVANGRLRRKMSSPLAPPRDHRCRLTQRPLATMMKRSK
jgi:hypothetical protein